MKSLSVNSFYTLLKLTIPFTFQKLLYVTQNKTRNLLLKKIF